MSSATCCSRWCSTRSLAQERGWFDFAAVARGIDDKLVRRHPHVFAGAALAAEDLVRVWEEQKAAGARRRGRRLAAARGARRCPAGAAGTDARREARQARRARRVRLADRPPRCAPRCSRNSHEVDAALAVAAAGESRHARRSPRRLGDLLFALVNWGRHLHVDPEEALRAANAKFERRFACMEALAARARAGAASRSPPPSGMRCGARQS